MMYQNYGKIELEIIGTVDRSGRSGIHKLGVLVGKNRDDVYVIKKFSKKILKMLLN